MNTLRSFVLLAVVVGLSGCGFFPAPDRPDGPSSCKIGQKVKFETDGTDPLNVHKFQWDFGDGDISDWDDDDESIKHRFQSAGKFSVRAKERCPFWVFWSGWSEGHSVRVRK